MSEIFVSTEGYHCVSNAIVYDLHESLIAGGYPMRTQAPSFNTQTQADEHDIARGRRLSEATKSGNQAHDQFLTGIRVSFDLRFSNKAWVEAERYRFLEFVSSQSTMHRITKFELRDQYNEYVDPRIIEIMEEKVADYNKFLQEIEEHRTRHLDISSLETTRKKMYLGILYSNPAGFELTARMTTNYRCLKNIYKQRHDHRLDEWRELTGWIATLPYAHELILCDSSS